MCNVLYRRHDCDATPAFQPRLPGSRTHHVACRIWNLGFGKRAARRRRRLSWQWHRTHPLSCRHCAAAAVPLCHCATATVPLCHCAAATVPLPLRRRHSVTDRAQPAL
eukprot:364690-Chlamydomonas_euryale.AAC.3